MNHEEDRNWFDWVWRASAASHGQPYGRDGQGALHRRYRALGGEMEVEIVPGKGHEECPEIFHSQRMVDFFIKHGVQIKEQDTK